MNRQQDSRHIIITSLYVCLRRIQVRVVDGQRGESRRMDEELGYTMHVIRYEAYIKRRTCVKCRKNGRYYRHVGRDSVHKGRERPHDRRDGGVI